MFVARYRPRAKATPEKMLLYILELEGGNYYVGVTDHFAKRFERHLRGTAAAWTKLHKPIGLLHAFEVEGELARLHERNVAAQMILAYGAPHVRGGGACIASLRAVPARIGNAERPTPLENVHDHHEQGLC